MHRSVGIGRIHVIRYAKCMHSYRCVGNLSATTWGKVGELGRLGGGPSLHNGARCPICDFHQSWAAKAGITHCMILKPGAPVSIRAEVPVMRTRCIGVLIGRNYANIGAMQFDTMWLLSTTDLHTDFSCDVIRVVVRKLFILTHKYSYMFRKLLEKVGPLMQRETTYLRTQISSGERLALFYSAKPVPCKGYFFYHYFHYIMSAMRARCRCQYSSINLNMFKTAQYPAMRMRCRYSPPNSGKVLVRHALICCCQISTPGPVR